MSKGVLTKQFYTSISVLKICDMNEIKSIINKDFCGERKSFLQLIEKYSIVIYYCPLNIATLIPTH